MTAGPFSTVTDPVTGLPKVAQPVAMTGSDGAPVSASNPLPVTPSHSGYTAKVTNTRPADTSAYTAGDVIGHDTSASSGLEFVNIAPVGGGDILITSAELEIDASSLPSGMTSFSLYLYSVTPPSALADNAAFDITSGDRASFLGKVSLGTPVDEGSTLYVATDGINKHVKAASSSLFGYLVTVGGYTPASGTVYKVTLHAIGL